MYSLRKLTQASNTLEWNYPLEITLNKQTLRGSANFGYAGKISQHQVVAGRHAFSVKIKNAADANRGINQESDIQPQGFAWICHLFKLGVRRLCTF